MTLNNWFRGYAWEPVYLLVCGGTRKFDLQSRFNQVRDRV